MALLLVSVLTIFGYVAQRNLFAATSSNNRILYDRGGIYSVDPNGNNPQMIGEQLTREGDWSPDGSKIVSSSPGSYRWPGIRVMNTDGSNGRMLTNPSGEMDSLPKWSPDGSKIVFMRSSANSLGVYFSIYTINRDGSNLKYLANNGAFPDWSPDGSKIVFTRMNDQQQLFTMNSDGSNQVLLYSGNAYSGSWSPDGNKIAVSQYQLYPVQGEVIGLVDAKTGAFKAITAPKQYARGATWSPDGSKIAYASKTIIREDRDGGRLHVMNADGSNNIRTGLVVDMVNSWHGDAASNNPTNPAPVVTTPSTTHPQLDENNPTQINSSGSNQSGNLEDNDDGKLKDTIPPFSPSGFSAVADSYVAAIQLNWQPAVDNVVVDHYQIERSQDQVTWQTIASSINRTYTDTNVSFDSSYFYRIRAVDTAQNASEYSLTEAQTITFSGNVTASQGGSISNSNFGVVAKFPARAIDDDAQCSLTESNNQEFFADDSQVLVGPMRLSCKSSQGTQLQSFSQPVELSIAFDTSEYDELSDIQISTIDNQGAVVPVSSKSDNGSVLAAVYQPETLVLRLSPSCHAQLRRS